MDAEEIGRHPPLSAADVNCTPLLADGSVSDPGAADGQALRPQNTRAHPRGPIMLESLGSLNHETLRSIAETGVD
jgi:hypothetical protein